MSGYAAGVKEQFQQRKKVYKLKPIPEEVYMFYVIISPVERLYFKLEEEDAACDCAKQHGTRVYLI